MFGFDRELGGNHTLQDVTDLGNTTTNNIELIGSNLVIDTGSWISFDSDPLGSTVYAYLTGTDLQISNNAGSLSLLSSSHYILKSGGGGVLTSLTSGQNVNTVDVGTYFGIILQDNSAAPSFGFATPQKAAHINSLDSSFDAGVVNSVILGGNGINADKDDFAFADNLEVSNFSRYRTTPALDTDLDMLHKGYLGNTVAVQSQSVAGGAGATILTGSLVIAINSVQSFTLDVTGFDTTTGDVLHRELKGAIKNIGGTTTLVGSITTETIADDTAALSWVVTATANDTLGVDTLEVTVTGGANLTKWKVVTKSNELTY